MSEHTANPAHPQPETGIEPDDLDASMIVAIGLLCTALLVASVLGVTALVNQFETGELREKVLEVDRGSSTYFMTESMPYGNAEDVVAAQQNEINGYAKPTNTRPSYTIPIDRAKELVLKDLQASRE